MTNQKSSSIKKYIYSLTGIIVVLFGLSFALFAIDAEKHADLQHQATEYHQATIVHADRIKEDVLNIQLSILNQSLPLLSNENKSAQTEAWKSALLDQANVLEKRLNIIASLQTRFANKTFEQTSTNSQRLATPLLGMIRSRQFQAPGIPQRTTIVTLRATSDVFLATIHQLERLHQNAHDDLLSGLEIERETDLYKLGLFILLLVLPGAIVIGLLIRRIERSLSTQSSAEERLRHSRTSLANAQRIARIGNWDWEIATGKLSWSDEIYRIFGLQPQQFEASYEAFLESIHPEDRQSVEDAISQSLETRSPYSIGHRIVLPDGQTRHVHEQGEATYGEDGAPLHMNGTVQDVTRRKRNENAINELNESLERRVEERSRQLEEEKRMAENYLAIAGSMIVALDANGKIMLINNRGCEVLGYNARELVGKSWVTTVVPQTGRSISTDAFARIMNGDIETAKYQENYVVTRSGEQRLIAWNNTLLRDDDGTPTGILFSGEDITQRRKDEEALHAAKEEAEEANQAKSGFLSNMSHELRTPLNAILGFGQLLDTGDPLNPDQKEYLSHILSSGEHLLSLINDVLDLSKIESGNITLSLEDVSPFDVFDETITLTLPLAEKHAIKLVEPICTGAPPVVVADFVRFKQVLVNLISNAIKYNRKDGMVTVTCNVTDEDRLRIAVIDTGLGIPANRRDELFQPFNRLEHENSGIEGTGIGLTITKQLVEVMGGSIGFDSIDGKGSTFWFELPLSENYDPSMPAVEKPKIPAAEVIADATGGAVSLLYVEDNPANLILMEEVIARMPGIDMLSAHSGELGLDLARAHQPNLIILDINLPGLDGYEVLQRLQISPETKDTPVLALSANAMPSDVKRGLKAGFKSYLTKPIRIDEVTREIRKNLPQLADNVLPISKGKTRR